MNIWIRVSYSVLMFITVAIAFVVLRKNQRRLPLSPDQRLSLAISAFVGTMIGAKLPFLTQLGLEGVTTGTIWFADGKTILGGIFGGYLTIEVAKSIQGIRVSTGDSFALPVAIAVFMGRIGCFIGGCCFGTVTDLPWGVHFPLSGDSPEMLRHPAQLYEAAFHLIGILVLILAQRNNWWPNQKLKVYLLAYLVYRFLSEWIRPEADVLLGLTLYQFASIGLAICLTMLWVRDERYRVSEQNQLSPAQSSGSG